MANPVKELAGAANEYRQPESNSVIGIKNGFSGEFHADGLLRIDGDFRGVVKGRGVVLIGEHGRIIGDVYAKSVRVGGKIKGNICALQKVEILSTGKLIGDLRTNRFLAEEGMVFTGKGYTLTEEKLEDIFKKEVDSVAPIINEDF